MEHRQKGVACAPASGDHRSASVVRHRGVSIRGAGCCACAGCGRPERYVRRRYGEFRSAGNSVAQAFRPAEIRRQPNLEQDQEPGAVLNFASRPTPTATRPRTADSPDEALTLLQVLESGEHVSWREAVAIVQQLCLQLKDVPSTRRCSSSRARSRLRPLVVCTCSRASKEATRW